MGEHQLTIRDYLRHANLARSQQVPASDVEQQAAGAGKVGRRHFACGKTLKRAKQI
jgi:hypothetical protein